jgi:hypothetical protein
VQLDLDVAIVSLFCAGGLFAYVREALRLNRLLSTGKVAQATIVNKEMDDSGSESIVHYLVTYEFVDEQGKKLVHEKDLNNKAFFTALAIGEKIEILYGSGRPGNSYPVGQIKSDFRLSCFISGAIILFWAAMVLYFIHF